MRRWRSGSGSGGGGGELHFTSWHEKDDSSSEEEEEDEGEEEEELDDEEAEEPVTGLAEFIASLVGGSAAMILTGGWKCMIKIRRGGFTPGRVSKRAYKSAEGKSFLSRKAVARFLGLDPDLCKTPKGKEGAAASLESPVKLGKRKASEDAAALAAADGQNV